MKVPIYEDRVESAPLRPPRASGPGPSGLEQLGRGLEQAGAAATGIATDALHQAEAARKRAEAVAASDAENALQAAITEQFYDDKTGALNARGTAALPAVDGAYGNISKRKEELAKGLTDEARKVFEARATDILTGARRTGEGHAATQTRVAEAATIEGSEATALDALARNPYDPELAKLQSDRAAGRIHAFALSPEAGDAQVAAFEKKAAATRLDRMLGDGDDESAAALLVEKRDVLAGDAAPYERKIGAVKARRSALSRVDLAMAAARAGDEDGWTDEAKARAAWKPWEITDPKERELAGADFEEALLLGKRQRAALIEANSDAALTQFNEGGLRAIPGEKADWLKHRAPEFWGRLKDRAIAKARDYEARQKGKRIPDTVAQGDALTELKLQIYRDPKRFATMTAAEFRTSPLAMQLSPRGFDEATDAFVGHQKATATDKGITAAQFKAQADAGQAGFGIPFTGKESQTKRDVYDREMAIYFASIPAGTRPSESELQAAIGRAGIKALGEEKAVEVTGERRRERDREYRENAPPAGEAPAPAAAAEPLPPELPLRSLVPVAERRQLPDGRVIEKLADGTTRIAQ